MITFLSILFFVGMLIFIVGLGWLIFSLIKKSKNFKVPAILMTIGAVCTISTFFIPFNDTNTSSTSQDSSTVSDEEDYEEEDEEEDSDAIDNSSSSSSSSSSAESSSSIDYTAELKAAVTSTMTKDSYQNIEDGVLEAAKVDDVNDNSSETPYALKRFDSRTKNLQRLQKQNNKILKEEKANLDSEHYSQLSNYTKSVNNYLETLYDYAIEYQTDVPSLNNPNTTSDTAETLRASLQEKKDAFDQAKQTWIQSYDSIVNQ